MRTAIIGSGCVGLAAAGALIPKIHNAVLVGEEQIVRNDSITPVKQITIHAQAIYDIEKPKSGQELRRERRKQKRKK